MRKFFRKLFSPTLIIVLTLVLEVLIIVVGLNVLDYYLDSISQVWGAFAILALRVALFVAEIIIFFSIIRKSENPEYKIPWITGMIVFPISTMLLYLIFANHGLRKKDRLIVEPTRKILEEGFKKNEDNIPEIKEEIPPQYLGLFNYLNEADKLVASKNNHITYYKNGEEFFPEFVESLKKAEKFIMMEFFIITEGKWWKQIEEVLLEKNKAGVEVMLIYDDMGSFGGLPNNYAIKLRKLGIKCYKFHPFRPILSGIYNNRDHRKIAVIDHKMAFTGGMNLADEYANDLLRFGYWKDTMVKIEGIGIVNLICTFLQNFDLSQNKISDYKKYVLGEDYPKFEDKGYIHFFGDGPGGFDGNEPIGEENYVQIINSSTKTLWISTPYLIPPYQLTEALKRAAKRGVDVKLFLPGIPDKKAVWWMAIRDFANLSDAGVKIYIYTPGFNHEKQIVADDILAFCGTVNFDFRSLTHHFECGATLYDVPCIKEMVEDFKEMENQSELYVGQYKLSRGKRILVAVMRIVRTLF